MRDLPAGTVTFCFTDIEGSTRLFSEFGPRFLDLLEEHRTLVRAAVSEHAGTEVRSEGDGFFLAFPDAAEAIDAAITLQRSLVEHTWPDGGRIAVRVGLHTGQAEPTHGDYLAFCVHEAARLAASGHGGQILVSQATLEAAGDPRGGWRIKDLGEHRFKDLDPMRVYQVGSEQLDRTFPPLRAASATRGYLPATTSTLIGRDTDLAGIEDRLAASRLVTITGAGGVGKTRVAVEAARAQLGVRADGVWFIDLAALTEPDVVDRTVMEVIGLVRDTAIPVRRQLLAHLSDRDLLLVLDNCEHLIDACSDLVTEILRTCPSVRVIATSREPFGIDSEFFWRLRSLSAGESSSLFFERASQVRPGIEPDEDEREAVRRLVERLDGIPLAIELAASRMRALSASQIAERLDDRFGLLTGGSRTALPRQRTLEATVGWSYALLDRDEQRLLDALSAFSGTFDLAAVEAVWGREALDPLERLVDKSMIVAVLAGSAVRYRMLETIRDFGWRQLIDSGRAGDVRHRHLEHFRDLVVSRADGLRDQRENETTQLITAEYANIRSALTWALEADPPKAVELVAHLWWYWEMIGGEGEGLGWAERALAAVEGLESDSDLKARVHACAAHLSWIEHAGDDKVREHMLATVGRMSERGSPPRWYELFVLLMWAEGRLLEPEPGAEEQLDGLLDTLRSADDAYLLAQTLLVQAQHRARTNDLDGALYSCEEALSAATRSGSTSLHALVLANLAAWLRESGRQEEATATAQEAVALALGGADIYYKVASWNCLGYCRLLLRRPDAREAFEHALRLATDHGLSASYILIEIGWLDVIEGRLDDARDRFEAAQKDATRHAYDRLDRFVLVALATHTLAQLAHACGEIDKARDAYLAHLGIVEGSSGWVTAYVCNSLGWLERDSGNLDEGEAWHRRAFAATSGCVDRQDRLASAASIRGLAGIAFARGNAQEAVRLSGMASAAIEPNAAVPRYGTILHQEMLDEARSALGATEFASAWTEGVTLGLPGDL